MKRSSSPSPDTDPRATLREPVRTLSTGTAASLSTSSVTSEDSGYSRVNCPITPASVMTGEPATRPWVWPRSITTLRE